MIHLLLHFIVPALVASKYRKQEKIRAYTIMMLTMLVDLDHLLANPIYDPQRCSIGFHPLHHPALFILYIGLLYFPKSRLVGLGLVIHMILDSIDCQFM